MKTNAMRILEAANIPFKVITYPVNDAHIDAMSVAQLTGLNPVQICKTVVTTTENQVIQIFCIPAPYEISLKKARAAVGARSIELVNQTQLRSLTGYIRGGVSPIGMIHPFPIYLEETVQLLDWVAISGGMRGIQLLLDPTDLAQVTQGIWADLV